MDQRRPPRRARAVATVPSAHQSALNNSLRSRGWSDIKITRIAREQARASNQWIVRTQEVLTASELVLTTVVDADNAVRSAASSSAARALEALDRADRTTVADVNRLAALTADNPNQQARMSALLEETARALSGFRLVADAKRASRVVSPADLDAGQARMNTLVVPFFTTKSRGSGLGLPTARRIIEAHRGRITITCPSAGGTIVTVQLPGEGHRSPVQLHQLTDDSKPKPQAGVTLRRRVVALTEALEYVGQQFRAKPSRARHAGEARIFRPNAGVHGEYAVGVRDTPRRHRIWSTGVQPMMTSDSMRQRVFRRMLAREAGTGASAPAIAAAAHRLCERLVGQLTPLIGDAGAAAICARSLHLTARDLRELAAVRASAQEDSPFALLQLSLEKQEPAAATEAAVAVLATVEFFNLVLGLKLTAQEKQEIVAFMRAL